MSKQVLGKFPGKQNNSDQQKNNLTSVNLCGSHLLAILRIPQPMSLQEDGLDSQAKMDSTQRHLLRRSWSN